MKTNKLTQHPTKKTSGKIIHLEMMVAGGGYTTLVVPKKTSTPVDTLQQLTIAKNTVGEWIVSPTNTGRKLIGTARSLRALVLGEEYSYSRRIAGDTNTITSSSLRPTQHE